MGSLHEDITITIKLPQNVKIEGDSVNGFTSNDTTKVLASGCEFIVTVNDSTVSPYHFSSAISVSLPYKRGLLNSLGINPGNLRMGFYSDSAGIDTAGIGNAVIDSSRNRIIADVGHFSVVVLYANRQTDVTGLNEDNFQHKLPAQFHLEQNYPNPFNPETNILYRIPHTAKVTIKVFSLLGQEIKTLIDTEQKAGTYEIKWNGRNSMGMQVSSGIYFYQIKTKDYIRTKKMMLIR